MSDQRDVLQVLAEARPRRLDPDTGPPALDLTGDASHAGRRRRRVAPARLAGGLALAGAASGHGGSWCRRPAWARNRWRRCRWGRPPRPARSAPGRWGGLGGGRALVAAERAERAPAAATGRYWVSRWRRGGLEEVGPAGDRYRIRVGTAQQIGWPGRPPTRAGSSSGRWARGRPVPPSRGVAPRRLAGEVGDQRGRPPIGGGRQASSWTRWRGPRPGTRSGPAPTSSPSARATSPSGSSTRCRGDLAELKAALLRFNAGGGGDLPTDRGAWLFAVGSGLVLKIR